jgi:hypothetical protein
MLDILTTEGVKPPSAASMVRMQIQPLHRPQPSKRDGQLKFCVPPMGINGPSYRLKNRLATIDEAATVA